MSSRFARRLERIPMKVLLSLIALLLVLNVAVFAGLALAQIGDIGGGVGFHIHMACRLVQPDKPKKEAYGAIRVLDVTPTGELGTAPENSCNVPAEQYIRIAIDHEPGAHP